MIRKILIYEVHHSNFNRYVLPFAAYLIEKKIADEVEMVYDSFVESDKIESSDTPKIRHRNAREAYREHRASGLKGVGFLTYSYRITDLFWTYKFKRLGARCFQQQHGMYAEFLERSFLGYFSVIPRKLVYLKSLLFFFFIGKWSIFVYMINKDFLKATWINDILEKRLQKHITPVLSDHVFVWGDYWKAWFVSNHFYPLTDCFTNIGNPDYHKFIKGKDRIKLEGRVCYIAQTFVEDGRMDQSNYLEMISEIASGLKDRLVIKMHPRSDRHLYQSVLSNGGDLTLEFPKTDIYLGHYSSLLALAVNEDTRVFLLEVNNEKIPEYFSNSADGVFTDVQSLLKAIDSSGKAPSNRNIDYYFKNIEEHPFSIISGEMTKQIGA